MDSTVSAAFALGSSTNGEDSPRVFRTPRYTVVVALRPRTRRYERVDGLDVEG